MNLKPFCAALVLGCSLFLPAHADDAVPPPDHPKHAEFCKNNPVTCEVGEQKREARKEWCDKNAAQCQALQDERKTRRQKMKEACDANPEECAARKSEIREKIKDRREHREHHQETAPAQ